MGTAGTGVRSHDHTGHRRCAAVRRVPLGWLLANLLLRALERAPSREH